MQTLSLNTSQSSQKNKVEFAGSPDAGAKNSASGAEKSPFQMELHKQTQEKKSPVQANQARAANAQKPIDQKSASSQKSATPEVEHKVKADGQDVRQQMSVDAADVADTNMIAGLNFSDINPQEVSSVEDVKAEDARLAKFIKEKTEAKADADVDANQIALFTGLPVIANAGQLPNANEVDADNDVKNSSQSDLLSDKNAGGLKSAIKAEQQESVVKGAGVSVAMEAKGVGLRLGVANTPVDEARTVTVRESVLANKLALNLSGDLSNKEVGTSVGMVQVQSQQIQAQQANNVAAMQQAGSSNVINVYPGKSGWDQAISQKVVWMVGSGEQTASLTLNPPDLGPLKVVIHVHNNQTDATFISDNNEVRKALETGLSNLRDRMSESGIQLGQANVSTSNQSQQSFEQAAQNRAAANATAALKGDQLKHVETKLVSTRAVNGLVDTFA